MQISSVCATNHQWAVGTYQSSYVWCMLMLVLVNSQPCSNRKLKSASFLLSGMPAVINARCLDEVHTYGAPPVHVLLPSSTFSSSFRWTATTNQKGFPPLQIRLAFRVHQWTLTGRDSRRNYTCVRVKASVFTSTSLSTRGTLQCWSRAPDSIRAVCHISLSSVLFLLYGIVMSFEL